MIFFDFYYNSGVKNYMFDCIKDEMIFYIMILERYIDLIELFYFV